MIDRAKDILKKYWGYDQFRPMQFEIIESVLLGKDTLGLLPTGGGKSLTFQIPAMMMSGVTIVVTPLIALMKDQVANLRKKGIKAYAVHSGLSFREIDTIFDNAIYGGTPILYLSPERLQTSLFLEKLKHLSISLLVVDEAHCISQWGYDFRPGYLKIADVKTHIEDVPVLALTATATPQVVTDIQEKLVFKKSNCFKTSYERRNLSYIVKQTEDKVGALLAILNSVKGSSVVYVRSRKKAKEYAETLNRSGISASYFHAGLSQKIKDQRQNDWMIGDIRAMVATNAFGMGIDKPDVRIVIHTEPPDSLEAYFQEAGRAGRDLKKSYAVLLWSPSDITNLNRRVTVTFPPKEVIRSVYNSLGNFFQIAEGSGENQNFDFNIGRFCAAYGFNILTVYNCLKILQRAGYISYSEDVDIPSKIMFLMDDFELYKFQVANAKLDPLIKVLLRSYTGLFTEYASIDETLIASRLNSGFDDIYKAILKLSRLGVLHYIPRRQTPLITFLQRRQKPEKIALHPHVYSYRLEQYKKRVDAVIKYGSGKNICRSRFLLDYFGEVVKFDCGGCDVCRSKRKRNRLKEHHAIESALLERLKEGPLFLSELINGVDYHEDEVWQVVRSLEEREVIYINALSVAQLKV
ncbi:RecQ family ATP-dependent DNA helicase [Marinilabiliaceae bacterium ANBcel2]|nr:RecQ family ATP-dependent DNA helicase [Marinilabiliaceae bacterium ANBcel2]